MIMMTWIAVEAVVVELNGLVEGLFALEISAIH